MQAIDGRIAELQAIKDTLAEHLRASATGPGGCDPDRVCSFL